MSRATASRQPLLPQWLRRPADFASTCAEPGPRERARRARFNEIGEFLFHHDLELSEANFAVAKAHLAGDPAIAGAVTAMLREHDRLTDAMLAPLASGGDRALRVDAVGELAERLAREAAECVRIIAASQSSGIDYRAALNAEVTVLSSDPVGALDRLIGLTTGMVDATRAMEEQLDTARLEAERLRSNLRRAQREADRDHLTGLPNRRHFEARLGALVPGSTAAVALCDIDDFKLVNDAHGHSTGDRVLKYIARLLRASLGESAIVARYGGEEFVCLFEDQTVAEAEALIEATRERLLSRSLANRTDGRAIGRVTFSTGVAAVGSDTREAVRLADEALYEAKRAGKNRTIVSRRTS